MSIYQDVKIYYARKADEKSARHSEATIIERKDKKLLMVWQNHYRTSIGGGDEAPSVLSMAISRDGLKTFTHFYNLETDFDYAYTNPSILVKEDGLFVMNYWTSKYNQEGRLGGDIHLKIATFRVNI